MEDNERWSRRVISHAPGMVFQYVLRDDGRYAMPFVSDQCVNVLGVPVDALRENPALFEEIILWKDRKSFRDSRVQSAAGLVTWNWEGRLWIESYHDVKWVSLRASPRSEKNVGVIWEGIIINITQSRQRETELKESHERLKEMSSHIMAAREHERISIAREIHDDLGGNLAAIKIDLDWLARNVRSGAGGMENNALIAKIHTVSQMVDRTIDSIQRISRDLRPGIMDFGIAAAIEWEAGEFSKRLGIPCDVVGTQQDIELEHDVAISVFRIFQEALTNIAKHGRASYTWVHLDVDYSRGELELEVRDDGCGITPADTSKFNSFGIRGMIERASLLDGKLTVSGMAGRGTTVYLSIPIGTKPGSPALTQPHSD